MFPAALCCNVTPGILAVFGPRLGFRGACPPKGRAHAEFPTLAKHDRFQLEASATPRKPKAFAELGFGYRDIHGV